MIETMKNSYDKQILEDKKISIAIMSSFVILTIQYLILIYFNLIDTTTGSYVQLLSKGIVGLLYLFALPTVLKRSKIKFFGVYFISIMIFLFNYLIFKENIPYLKNIIFPFFFTCLPSFIYAYSINDWNVLEDIMRKSSLIVFVVGTIIGVLVFTNKVSIGSYSMSLSYYMLLPAIIYINDFLDKVNIKLTVILLITLMIILALGSRGAIMCIGVFILLKIFNMKKRLDYKMVFLYTLIIGIVITMLIFLKDILEYMYKFLLQFGIESRSIRLFLRDDLYLSGRVSLYNEIINQILSNPFTGIGIKGDSAYFGGGYSHNIILEILSGFGIPVGSLLIIIIGFIILKSLFNRNIFKSRLILIWLCIGFVPLLVSGSYLSNFQFWIFLGLAIKILN